MSGTGQHEGADESAQWAALRKEIGETPDPFIGLGSEPNEQPTPPEPTPTPTPSPAPAPTPAEPKNDISEPPEPTEPTPKLSYEQLESNNRNTTEALRNERARAKKAEESLQKLMERITERQAPPPPPPPEPVKIPDVNEDPIGHFKGLYEQQQQVIEQLTQRAVGNDQQAQAQRQEMQFWHQVQLHEDAFRPSTPKVVHEGKEYSDYDLACDHLRNHRMQELSHLYPDDSAVAISEAHRYGLPSAAHLRAAILHQDTLAIAQRAFQIGVSPAKLYYEAAKGRGYVTPHSPGASPNGKIEAARRGQRAATTISGGEGRKSDADISLTDLADMYLEDPDEFDKQWERARRAGRLG